MNKVFRAMKFNIGDAPELSAYIQERLFKLGYKWRVNGKNTAHTEKPCISTWADGDITYGKGEHNIAIIDIEWMRTPKQRETIKVGNKIYYEDELAEALSKIKEVD